MSFLNNYNAVLTGSVYMLLPLMVFPLYNSLERIDKNVVEVSADLGATKAQTFFRVILPLSMPGVVGGFTLVFIPAVGLFFISDLLGGSRVILVNKLISTLMTSRHGQQFGAALSVTMLVVVMLFVGLYQRANRRKS
jgi:spermidine/putrescine transport system permease protein